MNYLELLVIIISCILVFAPLITSTDIHHRKLFKYEKKARAMKLLNNSFNELFSN